MAAQPFEQKPRGGKQQQSCRLVRSPEHACKRKGKPGEKCKTGGQRDHSKRDEMRKFVSFHQQGKANPVQPGYEIAKPEPPADQPCAQHAASGRLVISAVKRPDQRGQGDKDCRSEEKGGLREACYRAAQSDQ